MAFTQGQNAFFRPFHWITFPPDEIFPLRCRQCSQEPSDHFSGGSGLGKPYICDMKVSLERTYVTCQKTEAGPRERRAYHINIKSMTARLSALLITPHPIGKPRSILPSRALFGRGETVQNMSRMIISIFPNIKFPNSSFDKFWIMA